MPTRKLFFSRFFLIRIFRQFLGEIFVRFCLDCFKIFEVISNCEVSRSFRLIARSILRGHLIFLAFFPLGRFGGLQKACPWRLYRYTKKDAIGIVRQSDKLPGKRAEICSGVKRVGRSPWASRLEYALSSSPTSLSYVSTPVVHIYMLTYISNISNLIPLCRWNVRERARRAKRLRQIEGERFSSDNKRDWEKKHSVWN